MTKLLVVDDNPQNLYLLQVLLTANGFEVEQASNGVEALKLARRALPDMIISDILMPVMDGFALCRAWKADEQLKSIPFVFYTATYTGPKDEEFALSLGAERFIVKPQEPEKFLAILRETIETQKGERPVAAGEPLEEEEYYKGYNATLIRKLEDKVLQLEEANQALELDIVKRKQAEEALRESEERYRQLFETSIDAILLTQPDGSILAANPTACRVFGRTEKEIIQLGCNGLVDTSDPRLYQALEERAQTGSFRGELTFIRKDGSEFPGEVSTSLFLNKDGETRTSMFIRDITERKRAEEALSLRVEQLHALNRASQAATTSLDLDQVLTEVVALAGKVAGSDYTCVVLVDEKGHITRSIENLPGILSIDRRARKKGFTSWIVSSRRPAVVNEISEEGVVKPRIGNGAPRLVNPQLAAKGIKSFVGMPLVIDERIVGVLYLHSLAPGTFREQLTLLATFASQAAIAIEKARLYEVVQKELAERKQVEEALQKERDLTKQYLDVAAVLMLALDLDGKITLINPKGCEILGYKEEELLGRNWFDTCVPEDVRKAVKDVFRALMTGEAESVEYHENIVLAKGGVQRILAFRNSVIRDQKSRIVGVLTSGEDITERRRAEEQIQNLSRFPAENPYPVLRVAPDNQLIYANPASQPLLDLWKIQVGQAMPKKWGPRIAEAFRTGVQSQVEDECGERVLSFALAPIVSGGYVNIYGYDVTERKRAEKELQNERDLTKHYLDIAGVLIVALNSDGQITLINPKGCEILGYKDDELLGHNWFDACLPEGVREDIRVVFKKLMAGDIKPVEYYENVVLAKDGVSRTLAFHNSVIRDQNSQIVGILFSGEDITERKQAVEKLAQQTEELARLYRASGSLISGASLNVQELAQRIVEVVQQEFGQANCSLLVVQKDSSDLVRLVASGMFADQVKYRNLVSDGPGLVPLAIRTKKVVNVGDVLSDPNYIPGWDEARSEMSIPLVVGKDVIGVIDVQSAELNAFGADDERVMTIFVERAALALEHARLNAQTEARLQQLTALRTVDMAISGSFDINLTLGILLDQLTGQLGVHAVDILVFNPITQAFKFACERGFRTQFLQNTQLKSGAGYSWRVLRERRTVIIPDIRTEAAGLQRTPDLSGEQFVAYVGVPLIAKGQVKGVLEVFHREPLLLDREKSNFLEMLAGEAAIAVDNAELFDRLQSSNADLTVAYDSTLERWAGALEQRNNESDGCTRSMAEMTIQLTRALGMKESEMVHIYRGALLHDIGEVRVPDSILLKPGPLTEDELLIMRQHPQYAYDMLSPINYLRPALQIPYCHHERWDGTGYPRGLKGEQIPLAARIFAVVDVWDALTSDRPYRKAWDEGKVRQHLQEQAGQQFDPRVVWAFLKETLQAE